MFGVIVMFSMFGVVKYVCCPPPPPTVVVLVVAGVVVVAVTVVLVVVVLVDDVVVVVQPPMYVSVVVDVTLLKQLSVKLKLHSRLSQTPDEFTEKLLVPLAAVRFQ